MSTKKRLKARMQKRKELEENSAELFAEELQRIRAATPTCPNCNASTDHVYFCQQCTYIHCAACDYRIQQIPKHLVNAARIALNKSNLY